MKKPVERALYLAGVATWLVVVVPIASHAWAEREGSSFAALALGVVFLGIYLLCEREERAGRAIGVPHLALSSLVALACIAFEPSPFTPILLVISAAQIATVLSVRSAFAWITMNTLVLYLLLAFRGWDIAFMVSSAYGMFQVFAMLMSTIARREAEARAALQQANAELASMGPLLAARSRLAERLRIARDLHDIIGHHLTALSLNLEVARHADAAEAQRVIQTAQEIARKLLSEVRASVAVMRSDTHIDLPSVLHDMAAAFPHPRIHLEIEEIDEDEDAAETILRVVQEIITNSARHGAAGNLWLTLQRRDDRISIEARDDGRPAAGFIPGAGLEGMRERIQARGGSIDFGLSPSGGFALQASLPASGSCP